MAQKEAAERVREDSAQSDPIHLRRLRRIGSDYTSDGSDGYTRTGMAEAVHPLSGSTIVGPAVEGRGTLYRIAQPYTIEG